MINTTSSRPASSARAPRKPIHCSSAAPAKKPAPFRAFFDPVRTATQRNSFDSPPSPASILTLALADILFRSLAMPDRAWAAMTYGTDSQASGTVSMDSATTCSPMPMCMVRFSPMRAPSQPPTRLVTMPKNS
jgi:hypothetical protein